MSESLRLFWAVEVSQEVRDSLGQLIQEFKPTGADVRWVRPASIHLTIKFLGQSPAEAVDQIAAALAPAAAACPSLNLKPAGVGVFPSHARPRVIWAGLSGDVEELIGLAGRVDEALVPLGFAPEKRPFNPHLTLGRVKSIRGRSRLAEALARLGGWEGPELRAGELILFRSQLNPTGAVYTPLVRLVLGGQIG